MEKNYIFLGVGIGFFLFLLGIIMIKLGNTKKKSYIPLSEENLNVFGFFFMCTGMSLVMLLLFIHRGEITKMF